MRITEAWYRNPHNYVREMAEAGVYNVVWDTGMLYKRGLEPAKHAKMFFPNKPWRVLVVDETGTHEVGKDGFPIGAYPTWNFGESIDLLEDFVANPVGENTDLIGNKSLPLIARPLLGQEHRVVVMGLPNAHQPVTKRFLKQLEEIQNENPKCIIHLHGTWSYRTAFGYGYRAADIDPRTAASKGRLVTPSGLERPFDGPGMQRSWITQFGQTYEQMHEARERCIYNIHSAEWAGKSMGAIIQPIQRPSALPDLETPDNQYARPRSSLPFLGSAKAMPGDKFYCNECSLAMQCKLFRHEAVCTLPSAETQKLVKMFGSRKSEDILEGLSTIMKMGAERLGERMEAESESDQPSPEVTKMMNTLFDQGVKLAKLTDPALRGGVKVQVGVVTGSGGAQVAGSGTPRQLIAGIMREFEMQGFARSEITPAMVSEALASLGAAAVDSAAQSAVRGEIVGGE